MTKPPRSEASQECFERGVTDGHVWKRSGRQPPTPSNEDLAEWAGVEEPYADPAEHFGVIDPKVLHAWDTMMDLLFNAYEDGLVSGFKDADKTV